MKTISGRLFEIACASAEAEAQRAPLGYLRSGQPVWPITGAEPDDDDNDDDEDDSDDDDDDDDEDDDTDSGGDKSKKKSKSGKGKDDDEDEDDKVSRDEFDRMKRRMRKADQRASKAENDLRDLQRKGKPEDEQAKADLAEATKDRDKFKEENSTLRLQNAFLLNNTYDWHDPADVMAQVLKDDDVEIDEDGNVSGMEAALKRIAKKKPYLIKPSKDAEDDDDEEDDEDDEDQGSNSRKRQASGGRQTKRSKKGGYDRAKIIETYPALNRR